MHPEQTLPTSRRLALAIGSRFYANGRMCPHGHVSKYLTKDYQCYECHLIEARLQTKRCYERHGPRLCKDQAPNSICRHTRRYLLLPSYRSRHSKLLGCNGATLRAHIESLFTPGTSWDNYGRGADRWHLDHKIPLSKFDLHNPTEAAAAAHYTNVQPLWSVDIARKSWVMFVPT